MSKLATLVQSPDNPNALPVMEAASINLKPTFIVTTKLVLDLMFKYVF